MDKKTLKEFTEILNKSETDTKLAILELDKNLEELEASNEGDAFDKATTLVDITRLKSIIHSRQNQLLRIKAAKTRIDSGKFGECVSCGAEISKKRLVANPTSLLCIDCQEEKELDAKDSKARYGGGTMSMVDEENAPKGESEE